jgi:uncharacterized protein
VIAVITPVLLDKAAELYDFFASLGCSAIGINIEEKQGQNTRLVDDGEHVVRFWRELFEAWRRRPTIQIREFSRVLSWMHNVLLDQPSGREEQAIDLFPSVRYDGAVVLLSPEFIGTESVQHGNFIVGNVLTKPLAAILDRAAEVPYVQEFESGIET